MKRRTFLRLAASAAALPAASRAAWAQAYPSRPVTIVIPFAAGGATDFLGRLVAQRLSQRWGKQFIIENKAGAGGNAGVAQAGRSVPDGYTLAWITVSSHAINPSLYRTMPYDHRKDFAPISLVALMPNVLILNRQMPVQTTPELIAYLKENPGKVSFASAGVGTTIHLCGELFKQMTGTEMTHVPYRGNAPAMQDLISGQVQVMFDNVLSAWPQVEAGTVRALAVSSTERLKIAPNLPTISESLPGYSATAWHGLAAPNGTPKDIVERLSSEIQRFLQEPEVAQRLTSRGLTPVGNTPVEFATFIAEETDRWSAVVAKLGIKVD